jgi:hypothetical protein
VTESELMVEVVKAQWWLIGLRLKSRERQEAENLFLRHHLNILFHRAPRRVQLRNFDRLLFVWPYRVLPSFLNSMVTVLPLLGHLPPERQQSPARRMPISLSLEEPR